MITDAKFQQSAKRLGVEVATIRAVDQVESNGSGFLDDGQVKILFERHKFYQYLARKHSKTYADDVARQRPDICNPQRGGYKGGKAEHTRLQAAVDIDRECALMACSYGRYQVLASNWASLGYSSLQDFINAAMRSEDDHLEMFVRFVATNSLADELQRHDWAGFARGYNGPAYRDNDYDGKLAAAYTKFASGGKGG